MEERSRVERLERIRLLAEERDRVESAISDEIYAARRQNDQWGWTAPIHWRELGVALGVTGEAVRKRYRHLDPKVQRREQLRREAEERTASSSS